MSDWICAACVYWRLFLCMCVCVCVCTRNMGQAPWKQQQRSSAFKWIKTPAQSPGPAGIGQTGCSLDEDLRLIISHAAFVFAATVAYMCNTVQYMEICILYIFVVRQVKAIQTANHCGCIFLHLSWFLCLVSAQLYFEHQLLPTLPCCCSGKIPQLWMYTCSVYV